MNKIRRISTRLSIWILLFIQVLMVISYFYLKTDVSSGKLKNEKISFISSDNEKQKKYTYHTLSSNIFLKNVNIRKYFMDFNSSLCYTNGTDIISMKRSKEFIWECVCLPGWHGKDCGQPEVIWRAFLTYRNSIKIEGPRTFGRRIIYIFEVDEFSETLAEIRINELGIIVDLFVIYENSDFFKHKLQNNFLKDYHKKILYLKKSEVINFWKIIRNIKNDDIILTTNENEIPNKFALTFLKYYNKWPEPIRFRMRWSVFGFFWIHPSKTIITGGASSVSYIQENFNSNFHSLSGNKTTKGIILGDLNHCGGWFCEYCYDGAKIIDFITSNHKNINLNKINQKRIDNAFIEDIIENGLYIDGKIQLIRARRYQDNYFAPYHVLENNFKYDYLLINFYTKIDYYEG